MNRDDIRKETKTSDNAFTGDLSNPPYTIGYEVEFGQRSNPAQFKIEIVAKLTQIDG